MENNIEIQENETDLFLKTTAQSDNVVQIENDAVFLDALTDFVAGGFNANEPVITITIQAHQQALHERLALLGFDINYLVSQEQYFPLNAEETLTKYIVNGWPDDALYNDTIGTILRKAHKNRHRIRAYGEMLALLRTRGNHGAAMQLENLWNKFCAKATFCLFCAYPKKGFAAEINPDVAAMGDTDSTPADGNSLPFTELQYTTIIPGTTNNSN